MEYLGCGDIKEMEAIAKNLAEYVFSEEYTVNEVINEIMPFEYNLDSNDKAYVEYLVYKIGGFELC